MDKRKKQEGVYLDGKIWYASYTDASGRRVRRSVRRQNLVDLKLPELRETLAHQVVLMLITVMHLLAERQGL